MGGEEYPYVRVGKSLTVHMDLSGCGWVCLDKATDSDRFVSRALKRLCGPIGRFLCRPVLSREIVVADGVDPSGVVTALLLSDKIHRLSGPEGRWILEKGGFGAQYHLDACQASLDRWMAVHPRFLSEVAVKWIRRTYGRMTWFLDASFSYSDHLARVCERLLLSVVSAATIWQLVAPSSWPYAHDLRVAVGVLIFTLAVLAWPRRL